MPVVRLRRHGHLGCEHDIPIDITLQGIPDVGDRLSAPDPDEFLLVVEKIPLEPPVEVAVHSDATIGVPAWELRVLRLSYVELLDSAIKAVLSNADRWGHDEDPDPPPLIN